MPRPSPSVYAETRLASVPAMPPPIHSEDEDREFFAGLINGTAEVWLAESVGAGARRIGVPCDRRRLGALACTFDPGCTGQRIGAALLDLAKASRPDGFALWVFESNVRAQQFYVRHGLIAVRRTDGSANEERAPDIHMLWPGEEPIAALRDAIDGLDRELARLLELRSGLTAEVQSHKAIDDGFACPARSCARGRDRRQHGAVRPQIGRTEARRHHGCGHRAEPRCGES